MSGTPLFTLQHTVDDFRDVLLKAHAITKLDVLSHDFLCQLDPQLGENVQKLLYIFLSLQNGGNTCYSLDEEELAAKWTEYWEGQRKLAEVDGIQLDYEQGDFQAIIRRGIAEILKSIGETGLSRLFERRDSHDAVDSTRPFVIHDDDDKKTWCYVAKYFDAKCVIEDKIKVLFKKPECVQDADADDLLKGSILNEEQRTVVRRGIRENLIITGGPGTGKTTVVCFLLWYLLTVCPETQGYEIYLAAPSGKAADRMRESIAESIERLPDDASDGIKDRIRALESYTIHRLLSYSPSQNAFTMNAQNPFSARSIFVIDEASMIDIGLFASLLQAIPEGARVFILGDPDQLPSVEAGAVLGALLKAKGGFVAELTESKRFKSDSEIGRFAQSLQDRSAKDSAIRFANKIPQNCWGTDKDDALFFHAHKAFDRINKIQIGDWGEAGKKDAAKAQVAELVRAWTDRFYKPLMAFVAQFEASATKPVAQAAEPVALTAMPRQRVLFPEFSGQPSHSEAPVKSSLSEDLDDRSLSDADFFERHKDTLDALWRHATLARILSAERRGIVGVEAINRAVCTCLGQKPEELFAGRLLMLTKNLLSLRLYNGDSGVVLRSKEGLFYLLLHKPHPEGDKKVEYVKYPMSMLPTDALEDAFAITVHKSQGSGYPHVMVFLPTRKGHPLLTHEIVYTAVTRTMGQSVTIASNLDCFRNACSRFVKRDTGIVLKSE